MVDDSLGIQVAFLFVIDIQENCDLQIHKELVNRVVSSSLICKSARLRELFLYLCNRVLDESVDDIHELELGHKVFGRPEHYDTATDNIVRVHASLLRKRLAEHFQTEGINEPLIVEIPRGNYAPIFRKRDPLPAVTELPELRESLILQPDLALLAHEGPSAQRLPTDNSYRLNGIPSWILWMTGFLALGFASLSVVLLVRSLNQKVDERKQTLAGGTAVRQFWSGVFRQDASAQVVLDDASLDFYQEATGHPIALAEYFDRSYLHPAEEAAAVAHLDPKLVHSFLLKRQSNFAGVNLVSRLSQTAGALGSNATIEFARDFSFRQLKSGNMVLLGTRQSNPWIQPFDSCLALRWKFDPALDSYYPMDITANPSGPDKFRPSEEGFRAHEGYASIAFLANPGGTGNVLILSGTGGAAVSAALDFLNDESSMSLLRSRMNTQEKDTFPYFETLLRVEKGGSLPKKVAIVLSRAPQPVTPYGPQTAFAEPHR
jgi:hypothetical protein